MSLVLMLNQCMWMNKDHIVKHIHTVCESNDARKCNKGLIEAL